MIHHPLQIRCSSSSSAYDRHRNYYYDDKKFIMMFIINITILVMILMIDISSWHLSSSSLSLSSSQRRRLVYYDRHCPNDNNHCHYDSHTKRQSYIDLKPISILPIAHYDFTIVCNNNNNNNTIGDIMEHRNNNLIIPPITIGTNSSLVVPVLLLLFGSLYSNNPNMFHCQENKGLFLYTSTDIFGNKNRIDNGCSMTTSMTSATTTTTTTTGCNHSSSSSSSTTNGSIDSNNDIDCTTCPNRTNHILSSWDSIVLWIQPNDITYSGQCAMITIDRNSRRHLNQNHPMMTTTTTTTTIRILQYYSNILVILETIQTVLSNDDIKTMITTTTTFHVQEFELVSNQLTHLVLTIEDDMKNHNDNQKKDDDMFSDENLDIQVYINGQPMFLNLERRDIITTTTTTTTNNQQQDENGNVTSISYNVPTLQLFSNQYMEDDVFLGSIYQLDIYDTILSYDEVMLLYEYGVGYYDYSNTNDDYNSAVLPYYYNDDDDDDVFSYTTTMLDAATSKTQRPLMAKLSTRLDSISTTKEQQIGFIVVYQNNNIHPSNVKIPNSTAIIQIHSYNHSNPIMQLGIQITSLPTHGIVRLYSNGRIITTNGTIIDHTVWLDIDEDKEGEEYFIQPNDIYLLYGNITSMTISYQLLTLDNHYYNIPTHDGYGMDLHVSPEVLSYRIVEVLPILKNDVNTDDSYNDLSLTGTAANMMHIVKSSDIVTMPIYVVHVYDGMPPKIILGPYQKQQFEGSSGRDNSTPMMIILNDYQVMIQDGMYVLMDGNENRNRKNHNLDYVRVHVFTSSDGTITLNPDRLVLLSDAHEHCTQRYYSNWQCTVLQTKVTGHDDRDRTNVGVTGSGSSSITFVALPNDIPIILNQMIYTSHLPGQGGNIIIRIYSGTGGSDCLYANEHYWNYNLTNPAFDHTFPTNTNLSMIATTIIMDYMLLRNDTCSKDEATILIPNFTTDHMRDKNSSVGSKNDFMIFGFVWKEFILGCIVVSIFLVCFCGGCKCRILPAQPLALLPAIRKWILGGRRSKQQFNYNDYID